MCGEEDGMFKEDLLQQLRIAKAGVGLPSQPLTRGSSQFATCKPIGASSVLLIRSQRRSKEIADSV